MSNTCSQERSWLEAEHGFDLRLSCSDPILNHLSNKKNQISMNDTLIFTCFDSQSELKLLFYLGEGAKYQD